jgi:hypothetical protein
MNHSVKLSIGAFTVFSQPPPIYQKFAISDLDVPFQHGLLANQATMMEALRPNQGGDCISEAYLHWLSESKCLWHFQYGYKYSLD